MKKLFFLTKWNKKAKESTWSGTTWNLYQSLKKHFDICEVELEYTPSIVTRFKNKLFGMDVWIGEIMYCRRKVASLFSLTNESVVFQFAEILFDTNERKTYIFQDCSVSYIYYLKEYHPDLFSYSDFQDNNVHSIRKRIKMQDEYYRQCTGIFTMGKWLAKDLVTRCGINPLKVHAVGGGINVDISKIDDSHKNGNKILFIGRSFNRKGGYLVLSAFIELRKKHSEVELYVAGPHKNPVETDLPGYHFLGECNKKEIASLFNKCDVFCMPSYFEAYGLVFIEALSFGLPVIGRKAYEMPYFIEDGKSGYLLQNDCSHELALLIEKTLNNKDMKNYVKSKRNYYLTEYSWEKVAERIANIIDY